MTQELRTGKFCVCKNRGPGYGRSKQAILTQNSRSRQVPVPGGMAMLAVSGFGNITLEFFLRSVTRLFLMSNVLFIGSNICHDSASIFSKSSCSSSVTGSSFLSFSPRSWCFSHRIFAMDISVSCMKSSSFILEFAEDGKVRRK